MTVGFRSLLFTLFIPGSATVWIPWLIVSHRIPAESTVPLSMRLPGGFLIATGAVLYFGCLWDFTVTGRGTPAVWDPPVVFVSKGLYRFVRNPMYLAIVSILVGEALFLSISAFGMDGSRIRRRISLVCCVLRGKGLEAKVWGFVRAVLLRSLAVAAALTWTIATTAAGRLVDLIPEICRGRA